MNTFRSEEQRRLEQATMSDPGDESTLDRQSASLRDGWTAFAQLLDASARPVDEEELVRKVNARLDRHDRRRQIAWLGMAASVLIAAGWPLAGWVIRRTVEPADVPRITDVSSTAVAIQADGSIPSQSSPSEVTDGVSNADPRVWNDDWDEEIELVRDRVGRLAHSAGDVEPVSFAIVRQRISELERDLAEGSL